MKERRTILKLGLGAAMSALVAPARALFGNASTQPNSSASTRPTSADEKVVRTFFGQGWSEGNVQVIESHPATVQECARLLERFRKAFPDLRVDVNSIARLGDDTLVKWTAHGTNRGSLGGVAPTGRKVNIPGSSKMRIVGGKIVSSTADWDDAALQRQLSTAPAR